MKLHYLISVILLIYVKEKVCMEQGAAEIRKIQNQVCDPYLFCFFRSPSFCPGYSIIISAMLPADTQRPTLVQIVFLF